MRENSLPINKRLQDNPLELPIQTFATWLTGEGYAQKTVQLKLGLLVDLGEWLGRTGRAITHLDEQLLQAFAEHKQLRVHVVTNRKPFKRFIEYLGASGAVPYPTLVSDQSTWAGLSPECAKY